MSLVGFMNEERMNDLLMNVSELRVWFPMRKGLFGKVLYVKAVDAVSLNIKRAETLAIVGESGCGKTTLGRTMIRLIKPTSGKIVYDGKDITNLQEKELRWLRSKTAMVFQDPYSSLSPNFNIFRILEEPLIVNKIGDENERAEMVYKALEDVRLIPPEDFAPKYPHMISGGQRQRVAIARAMVIRPELIIADEPVSMLDASIRVEILYLLKELQKRYNIAFVYITHDIATVKYFSDRIGVMYAGEIVELGDIMRVLKNPLHPYTQALIEAIPDPDPKNRFRPMKVVPGEPPNPINHPRACRFHPRCPYFMKGKCDEIKPEMKEIKPNHFVACHLY
jgi:peptide/nickel transport system ATP-binding protein